MNKNATNTEQIEIYSSWFIADVTCADKENHSKGYWKIGLNKKTIIYYLIFAMFLIY